VSQPAYFEMGGHGVSIKYYHISYNAQEYEMRTLSESGDFSEIERLYMNENSGMIASILCYFSPSVEFLGPRLPSFQTRLTPLIGRLCMQASLCPEVP